MHMRQRLLTTQLHDNDMTLPHLRQASVSNSMSASILACFGKGTDTLHMSAKTDVMNCSELQNGNPLNLKAPWLLRL